MISAMDEITKVLKQEFDAEEGSFLLRLRGDLEWDRAAFTRGCMFAFGHAVQLGGA